MKWSRMPGWGTHSGSETADQPGTTDASDGVDVRVELRLEAMVLHGQLNTPDGVLAQAEREVGLAAAEAIAAEMGAILNRATRWGDVDQGSRTLLRQRGELLFDSMLPAALKAGLRDLMERAQARPPRLLLVLDQALLGLPWELMHTGVEFVGLGFAVGRLARGLQAELELGSEPARAWRTLVVCDPRGDLIGSYYEGLTLRDQLAQGDARVEVDLRSSEVSLAEVRRLLREYDVVHFAGHAERGGGEERGWWLQDGVLGPSAIRELAGGRRFPRLIFSNACRSAGDGTTLGGRGATGLAAAFLEAGVEHYIGTVQDVPDEPASLFALTFYATLRARPDAGIGEAVRAARVMLAERYGPDSVYWASWVLYGTPADACLAGRREVVALAKPVHPAPVPGRAGYAFHEAGARVRGAVAQMPAANAAASDLRWARRGVGVWLGLLAVGVLVAMLAGMIGGAPPVAWVRGKVLGRIAAPARSMTAAEPHDVPPKADDGTLRDEGDASAANLGGVEAKPRFDVLRADAGAAAANSLVSGESFRLRLSVPEGGVFAIWQVESQGSIRRIDSEGGPLRPIEGGRLVEVPDEGRWFWLDERTGTERFYLAWRLVPPTEPSVFEAELLREVATLGGALEAAERLGRAPKMLLRGLGGVSDDATVDEIRARFEEELEDRFDTVTELVVEHR